MQETPKALFFDVDGTIIWHKPGADVDETVTFARPTDRVIEAFHTLRERGHQAFICTGRPLCRVSEALRALDATGIISSAGACVSMNGSVMFDRAIPSDQLERLIACAQRSQVNVMFEGTNGCVVLVPEGRTYESGGDTPVAHDASGMQAATDMRFNKFVLENGELEAFRAEGGDFLEEHFTLFDLGLGISEMTVTGVDKGYGVRCALEQLGHGRAGTLAFGDSENDLPMAREVETFVAMGNAMPAVKDAAAYVTDSVEHDGVVSALEHFGLL